MELMNLSIGIKNLSMDKLSFQLHCAGYCTSERHHALRGAKKETIDFVATYGIINHPTHGIILIDTGYTRRFYEETKKFPFSIYARVTPVYIEEREEAKSVLLAQNIKPQDVKFIIITHFHADHIAGLKDFPNAKFIASKKAFDAVKDRHGIQAVRKAFVPNLLPLDFIDRVTFVDWENFDSEDEHLGPLFDIFKDETIKLCKLDGHAHGQIGVLLNTDKGQVFMVADGAWLKANYQEYRLPNPIVRLFFDSWSDYKQSLKRIHNFHKANPNVPIIPCHCKETFNTFNAFKSKTL